MTALTNRSSQIFCQTFAKNVFLIQSITFKLFTLRSFVRYFFHTCTIYRKTFFTLNNKNKITDQQSELHKLDLLFLFKLK